MTEETSKHEVVITNGMIEIFFTSASIQKLRFPEPEDARRIPYSINLKIYQVSSALSESPEAKFYSETKRALSDRILKEDKDSPFCVYPRDDRGREVREGGKAVLRTHPKMQELLAQDSGIRITKPVIPLSLFPAFTSGDMHNAAWIFRLVGDEDEMNKIEGNKPKPNKPKPEG